MLESDNVFTTYIKVNTLNNTTSTLMTILRKCFGRNVFDPNKNSICKYLLAFGEAFVLAGKERKKMNLCTSIHFNAPQKVSASIQLKIFGKTGDNKSLL